MVLNCVTTRPSEFISKPAQVVALCGVTLSFSFPDGQGYMFEACRVRHLF